MIDRVILMCAGRAERWANHLGLPKHLIPVDGEPLLDRSLRLIRQHTPAPVTIVAFNPAYERPGTERFEPLHGPTNFCDTDKFLSAQQHWSTTRQTALLYGDVFFTQPAMATILAHTGPHRFFGRREHSYFTGCPWRELFALSFPPEDHDLLRSTMTHIRDALHNGSRTTGGGWDLYHYLHGTTWNHFTSIDDFTDDFDFPADYDRFIRRYQNPLHRTLAPLLAPHLKSWHWRLQRWSRKLRPQTPPAPSPNKKV